MFIGKLWLICRCNAQNQIRMLYLYIYIYAFISAFTVPFPIINGHCLGPIFWSSGGGDHIYTWNPNDPHVEDKQVPGIPGNPEQPFFLMCNETPAFHVFKRLVLMRACFQYQVFVKFDDFRWYVPTIKIISKVILKAMPLGMFLLVQKHRYDGFSGYI